MQEEQPGNGNGARSGTPGTPRLSIVMPVWNEGEVLVPTVRILQAILPFPHEAIFVVDDDEDDSIPVVERLARELPHVRLVRNRRGRGPGLAVRAGIDASRGQYILVFPADDFGPALSIEATLELLDAGCDLVSGTRYARGGRRIGGSAIQGIVSRAGNWIFYWISGSVFSDGTTCFKAFRKSIFETVSIESPGWEAMYELSIKAQLAGLKPGEVPITSIDRLYGGKSTFQLGPWLRRFTALFVGGIPAFRRVGSARPRLMVSDRVRTP